MNTIDHYTAPHIALWKSCAVKVLAEHGQEVRSLKEPPSPLLKATAHYCQSMENNQPLADPGADSTDQMAVGAFLSYLHHKKAHARIAGDGQQESLLEKQIAQYKFGNPLWQQMFIEYHNYYWQYPYHKGAEPLYRSWQSKDWGKGNLQYGMIDWKLPADAKIAIVGDIGTGTTIGEAVLEAALSFGPDAVLHLGDVYYSGTQWELQERLVAMVQKIWRKKNTKIPFFTIPGNHEYLTGNVALLDTLDNNALVYEDQQRQVASYFCLRTEDDGWQFLGMDTGYHGHYMNVAKGAKKATLKLLHLGPVEKPSTTADPHWPKDHNPYFEKINEADLPQRDTTHPDPMVFVRPDELIWHKDKLDHFEGKTVLLSHHQLYSALDLCGLPQKTETKSQKADPNDFNRAWINTALWRQFGSYLGDQVPLWIWGHEHNLCIYKDNYRPKDWPKNKEADTVFKNLPKGRCAGHGALPVQDKELPYEQKYPVPLVSEDVKLGLFRMGKDHWYNHGFQIMKLAGAQKPAQLFYYQVQADEPIPLLLYKETVT